jgi:hypothetical protein
MTVKNIPGVLLFSLRTYECGQGERSVKGIPLIVGREKAHERRRRADGVILNVFRCESKTERDREKMYNRSKGNAMYKNRDTERERGGEGGRERWENSF